MLAKVTYALNVSDMRIGSIVISPHQLYFGRPPSHWQITKEPDTTDAQSHEKRAASLESVMEHICRIRNVYTPLLLNTDESQQFRENQLVMCWREFISKERHGIKQKVNKLKPRWELARVKNREGSLYLIQPLSDGRTRVCHRRILRAVNNEPETTGPLET